MASVSERLAEFDADLSTYRDFSQDEPDLLPYATLLAARSRGHEDLAAVQGVYEWQGAPLLFLVDGSQLPAGAGAIQRLRRLLALRGDAPYLGVLNPGRLTVYQLGLDTRTPRQSELITFSEEADWRDRLAELGNFRPRKAIPRKWISDVVLRLLSSAIDELKNRHGLSGPDSISLVGRALFLRFLMDRELVPSNDSGFPQAIAFSNAENAIATCAWLDKTFNENFLPLDAEAIRGLGQGAFSSLTNIMSKAPEGQFFLGWKDKWDYLDFAHIPVGVLSQAYEKYLQTHAPEKQRKEGSYYTPLYIVDLMVRASFYALPHDCDPRKIRILDPAAGAGVYLISAFRELVAASWKRGPRPDTARLREILDRQLQGFDVNEAALRFAALGLYLIAIELDPNPEPVEKLRFRSLLGGTLQNVSNSEVSALGSLGRAISPNHNGAYDLVIGNPPWTTGTQVEEWETVEEIVAEIAGRRIPDLEFRPPLPNEALDLPFLWRAMEWAKPGGRIAFAAHARLLFQQGEGMPEAREALFRALDITGIVNGTDLRQTKVWPGVSAPFCLIFATNTLPSPQNGFRFISPRLEHRLNDSGEMRVDAQNSDVVTVSELITRPYVLKALFRGSRLDLEVLDRMEQSANSTIFKFWSKTFGVKSGKLKSAGNGYQKLRESTSKPKDSSSLHGLPHLEAGELHSLRLDIRNLQKFSIPYVHRLRDPEIYRGPMLLVHKSPPAGEERIRVAVSDKDVVYSETFYGYSAAEHPEGVALVRFLALAIGSKFGLWHSLLTSGEFGFEREVIEKFIIDQIPMISFDDLSEKDKKFAIRLFEDVSENDSRERWEKVDKWFSELYGLRKEDIQVIADTLRYSLPFSESRDLAQRHVTWSQIEGFSRSLTEELRPWAARARKELRATNIMVSRYSPWKVVYLGIGNGHASPMKHDWHGVLHSANRLASAEVIFRDQSSDGLWIAKLDQARYWSRSEARLVARRIIWEHADLFEVAGEN